MYLQEYQRKLNDSEERNKDLISDTKLLSVRIKTLESQLLDLKVSKCVIIFILRNEPILIITLLCFLMKLIRKELFTNKCNLSFHG